MREPVELDEIFCFFIVIYNRLLYNGAEVSAMQKERNYQFRKRLLQIHKPNRRMEYAVCGAGQIEVTDEWSIWIPHTEDRVLYNAARDLLDYFAVSMGLSLRLQAGERTPCKGYCL